MCATMKAMAMTEEISIYMKAVLLRLKSQAREKGSIRVENLPTFYFRFLYKGHQVLVLFVFFFWHFTELSWSLVEKRQKRIK